MKAEKKPKSPYPPRGKKPSADRPIPDHIYPVIDTDLGRDNVENDLPAADREDL